MNLSSPSSGTNRSANISGNGHRADENAYPGTEQHELQDNDREQCE